MRKRKGIILAGGFGTRLHPLTAVISKQLLPIYNKPMIFYPLSNLIMSNINEILIISTPFHLNFYKTLLGNGKNYGLDIKYKIQKYPNGIAEGIILAENFLKGSDMCLILGDNIIYGKEIEKLLSKVSQSIKQSIFIKFVKKPNKYGVVKFQDGKAIEIIEKPKKYISNYAVTGIYFYSNKVIKYAKKLKPSKRKELEITDLNNLLLNKKELKIFKLNKIHHWYDAGDHEDYLKACIDVRKHEISTNQLVGSLEIESFKKKYLSKKKIFNNIKNNNIYYEKIIRILKWLYIKNYLKNALFLRQMNLETQGDISQKYLIKIFLIKNWKKTLNVNKLILFFQKKTA